jgi:hypothetical protein
MHVAMQNMNSWIDLGLACLIACIWKKKGWMDGGIASCREMAIPEQVTAHDCFKNMVILRYVAVPI